MHIISESALMPFTPNYQNQCMLVETTACQSWLVFDTQCSLPGMTSKVVIDDDTIQQATYHFLLMVTMSILYCF